MLDRRSQRQQAPVQAAILVACRYHHHQTRRDIAHTSSTDAISGSGTLCTQEFIDRRNPAGPVSPRCRRTIGDRPGTAFEALLIVAVFLRTADVLGRGNPVTPQNGEHFAASGLRWD